jgi:hypothetical protein
MNFPESMFIDTPVLVRSALEELEFEEINKKAVSNVKFSFLTVKCLHVFVSI